MPIATPSPNATRRATQVGTLLGLCALVAGLAFAEAPLSDLDLRLREAELAPTIRVQEAENRTTEEYRVNGNLYMIKIRPVVGAPYYLIDHDGSGDMGLHRGGSDLDTTIPTWALLSW